MNNRISIIELLRSMFSDIFAGTALIVVTLYIIVAISVEGYSIYCKQNNITPVFSQGNIEQSFQPPSASHIFGTDYLGRDVGWRALGGTSTAIKVGASASLISAFIGVILGVIAGYYGGKVDHVVVWIYSTFASMPTLLFILTFALLVKEGFLYPPLARGVDVAATLLNADPGMLALYLGIGLTGWVTLCRVVRGETMKLREAAYIQSAKVSGCSTFRIITRHIIPNLFHLVIIYFTLRFAYAVMTEVIVSYLGLGVQLAPSWGVMIADGQERLWRGIWWEVATATGFMFFLVLSLHTLGDALRDRLDPRLKK
ncbi:MAG: ABC transporter permease [Victivallaceae bacterium]|nr:ABC transporter permease [Victivallaceae bacterium]